MSCIEILYDIISSSFGTVAEPYNNRLKVIPNNHSSATWCVMVNASMWCLPILISITSGVLEIIMGMIKKVIHFNGKNFTMAKTLQWQKLNNMILTQIFHEHIYKVFQ